MKISFAIPVCNEHGELRKLLGLLYANFQKGDEVVVMQDKEEVTSKVLEVIEYYDKYFNELYGEETFKTFKNTFEGSFSEYKNKLNSKCTGDYIFQLDADELPGPGLLGENLHNFLKSNTSTEVFILPRKNTIDYSSTDKEDFLLYCRSRGWMYDENRKLINWPDSQPRIYKNVDEIEWHGKVHESLVGFTSYSLLTSDIPEEDLLEGFSLIHHKKLDRQKRQNEFYDELIQSKK